MDRDFYLTRKVDEPAPTRWYQFTLRRILAATACAAAWCGVLVYLRSDHDLRIGWLLSGLIACFALGPFLAVGILVGHPYWSLLIGAIVSSLIFGAMLLYALNFSPC